jgi:serine/threonine-protein kinase
MTALRRSVVLALAILHAGCGRIHFADRKDIGDGGDGDTLAGDSDASPPGFTNLIAYGDDTCALFAGHAYCWGKNASSQIGDGTTVDAPTPTQVHLPAGTITAIAQGDAHGCALVDGNAYCWGTVGGANPTHYAMPAPATAITAGNGFACALADTVYCWGVNNVGQCGSGTTGPAPNPAPVMFTPAYPATAIEAGDDHACAFAPSTAPQCWGHNDNGTLGFGSTTPTQELQPVAVTGGITTLPHIAGWHACALATPNVKCWGEGTSGELGNNMTADSSTPVQVAMLGNASLVETGGGPTDHDASCAIDSGSVYCWGRGNDGRLGAGNPNNSSTPKRVNGLPAAAIGLALGYGHACALLTTGDIYCWGRGTSGQLGDGNKTSSLTPVAVVRP